MGARIKDAGRQSVFFPFARSFQRERGGRNVRFVPKVRVGVDWAGDCWAGPGVSIYLILKGDEPPTRMSRKKKKK